MVTIAVGPAPIARVGDDEAAEMVGVICDLACESSSISKKGLSTSNMKEAVLADHQFTRVGRSLLLARCVLLRVSHHVRIAKVRVGKPRLSATTTSGGNKVILRSMPREDVRVDGFEEMHYWRGHSREGSKTRPGVISTI
jgi:hypothetical protein